MPVRTDDFNRSDANPIGGNWTAFLHDSAGITSQLVGPPPDVENLFGDFWNADSFGDDQYAQCNIHNASGMPFAATGGPCVRCSGTTGAGHVGNSSGYLMYYAVTVTQLTKAVSGTETLVGTRTGNASNDALDYIEAQGSTLKLKRGGTQLGADFSDSSVASGAPGIMVQGSGGQADNWEVGDFGVTRRWLLKRTA